jgi:N-acetylmuramoyl-L-alanine amidase
MSYRSVVISSGHGLHVRGAHGIIDEVDEARVLTDQLGEELRARGVDAAIFHDNTSYDQSTNLNTITDFHNDRTRELDISIHFNAYEQVSKPMGVEVLYVTQQALAAQLSSAIAMAGGLINRGAKKRTDLHFLNVCDEPAVLLEVCFVDSQADCDLYRDSFDDIVDALADAISGLDGAENPVDPDEEGEEDNEHIPPGVYTETLTGKVSWFGGPEDEGVSADEGLAFIYDVEDAPHLFLPYQPDDTTGLARRLNPFVHYIAMRWNYDELPKATLLETLVLVRNPKTGFALTAFCADWGPAEHTDRIADLSPGLMSDLGLKTDDIVEVTFPYKVD